MSDIYLSLTETPSVVTLSQPVVSGVLSSNVTVTNVVSVNVVTMPAITVQAAAPAVTTVAGSVAVSNLGLVPSSVATDGTADGTLNFVKIGGHQSGSNQTAHIVHVSAGGSMSVDATDSVVSISNFPSTQTVAGTVTANVQSLPIIFSGANVGTLGSGNFITDSGGPANDLGIGIAYNTDITDPTIAAVVSETSPLPVQVLGGSVTIGSLPAISGTVTANVFGYDVPNGTIAQIPVHNYDEGFAAGNKAIPVLIGNENGGFNSSYPLPVSGTVTVGNSVTIGSLPAISGTVTAAAPNGSLTTRFGTPTTANTAFATSAVTNANRKYLLIQNVTTGSNVITVGIGFTPTTTQGIQLTAGAGITFESSYIPTGQIFVLSSVTASNFTILEA